MIFISLNIAAWMKRLIKIASYIPLEWKNGKLEKVLLASMDVTQEKKAEIESRQALKEAYRSAEKCKSCENRIPFQYVPCFVMFRLVVSYRCGRGR